MAAAWHPSWPGWSPLHALVLPLDPALWPPPARAVTIDGIAFAPKRELHVTIVGKVLGAQLQAAMAAQRLDEAAVRDAFAARDWHFARHADLLRLEKVADDGGRCGSLIELLDMPAMEGFHRRLGRLLGCALPVPPPHVTLYTAGDAEGIGVPDVGALRLLAVRAVAPSELDA